MLETRLGGFGGQPLIKRSQVQVQSYLPPSVEMSLSGTLKPRLLDSRLTPRKTAEPPICVGMCLCMAGTCGQGIPAVVGFIYL